MAGIWKMNVMRRALFKFLLEKQRRLRLKLGIISKPYQHLPQTLISLISFSLSFVFFFFFFKPPPTIGYRTPLSFLSQ